MIVVGKQYIISVIKVKPSSQWKYAGYVNSVFYGLHQLSFETKIWSGSRELERASHTETPAIVQLPN